jgi:plasmid stabilization system protein ParE
MSLPVVFRRAARAEFDDAADWYDHRRAGLGAAFTAAVERVLDQVAAQPDFYPQVYQDVREALVPGYPYCVYYREEPGQVVVLAVFHTSRDPSIWQGRA